jgi:hypothetical protein
VGIISKPDKPELVEILPRLFQWFEKRDYRIVVDPETAVSSWWFWVGTEPCFRRLASLHLLEFQCLG